MQAQAELERRRRARARGEGLLDFFRSASPQLDSPTHLSPILDAFERAARGEAIRAVISTPPQHGKTLTTQHSIVWGLRRNPALRYVYCTYEAQRAWDVSMDVLSLAQQCKVSASGSRRRWLTPEGGGLLATGIGGPLTGYPVDGVLIIDDPVKNSGEAESATFRERTVKWFQSTAMTRVHKGASVIVIQTRWHPDDLAGYLIRQGWETINLPAINDGTDPRRALGEALYPSRWPVEVLEQRKQEVGEFVWASLYQGQPRPRGGRVFQDVRLCDALPRTGYRVGIGVDLAYTAKSKSDYSTIVVLLELGGVYHVAEVLRKQVRAPEFKDILHRVMGRYPGTRPRWYCAGVEIGAADLVGGIDARNAVQDKFLRAQPVAAAWNAGDIVVLKDAPWINEFLGEVLSFTGVNDEHDDMVDAFAAAYDALQSSAGDYDSLSEASGW